MLVIWNEIVSAILKDRDLKKIYISPFQVLFFSGVLRACEARLQKALGAGSGVKGLGGFPALRFPPDFSERDK